MTLFDEGYERVFKTAGLVKEAINPSHLLKAVSRPDGAMSSLERHFPRSWLAKEEVPEWVAAQMRRSPERDAYLSSQLTNNPMSTAIRKQWPKAKQTANKLEAAENRAIQDINAQPFSFNSSDDFSVVPETSGAMYNHATKQIATSIRPETLLHEARHGQQHVGIAGPTAHERANTPQAWRSVPDTLALERDANLYALQDAAPEARAETAAAQGTYERAARHNLFGGNMWDDPVEPHPEATPARLRDRAQRIKELRNRMYEKSDELKTRLPEWVKDFKTIEESLAEFPGAAGARLDADLAQYRLARVVAAAEEQPGRFGGDVARAQKNFDSTQARLKAIQEIIDERRTEIIDPKDVNLWDALVNRAGSDSMINEAMAQNRNPLLSEDFWRGATPELVDANMARHRENRGMLRKRLGQVNADAYDDAVMAQLRRIGAPIGTVGREAALSAPSPTAQQGKPSGFVDKLKGLFG